MQLVLPVSFRKQDCLQTFVNGKNEQLVLHLTNTVQNIENSVHASQRICVISGESGVGKSHLLLAICEHASSNKLSHQYIDLAQIVNMPTELLIGFINKDVVCIDNLQVINGMKDWQRAIFDAINQFTESNARLLVIATKQSITTIDYKLPDLRTRLLWGTNFVLHGLSDDDKQSALTNHMIALGISYTDDVIPYLIHRTGRNMHELINTLDILDKASLETKRKVTVPFVKSTLKIS